MYDSLQNFKNIRSYIFDDLLQVCMFKIAYNSSFFIFAVSGTGNGAISMFRSKKMCISIFLSSLTAFCEVQMLRCFSTIIGLRVVYEVVYSELEVKFIYTVYTFIFSICVKSLYYKYIANFTYIVPWYQTYVVDAIFVVAITSLFHSSHSIPKRTTENRYVLSALFTITMRRSSNTLT